MTSLTHGARVGAAAGAAGTTALDATTYLDMTLRGRAASSAPLDTARALSDRVPVPVPGEGETRDNRLAGLGSLLGLATGTLTGAVLGAARAAGWRPGLMVTAMTAATVALVAGDGPMTALRVTDPRTWSSTDWAADVLPHMAYGVVTAAVLIALDD